MSFQREITCPDCQNLQRMTLWRTVNVTLDPHFRGLLMDQKLNVFECTQCGRSEAVDVSLLYHDMEQEYCVQYVAKEDMQSQRWYQSLYKDGTIALPDLAVQINKAAGISDYLQRPNYVFAMTNMLLYVAFRDLCAAYGQDRPTAANEAPDLPPEAPGEP